MSRRAQQRANLTMEKMSEMKPRSRWSKRALARGVVALAAASVAPLGLGSAAQALTFEPGSVVARTTDNAGNELTQAGAHPNATVAFDFATAPDENGNVTTDGDMKDLRVDLPVGVVGNPTSTAQCAMEDFATNGNPNCPTTSQVGVANVNFTGVLIAPPSWTQTPVYNLVPPDGKPARFGFRLGRNNVVVDASVRPDDYGITATVRNAPNGVLVYGSSLTFWGVPADSAHDSERFRPGADFPGDANGDPLPANVTPEAFFTNPTSCGAAPVTRLAVNSWQQPDVWDTAAFTSPVVTGCDRIRFDPSLTFRPTTAAAGQPSGYNVRLAFRQNENPVGLAPSALRTASVTLPSGVVVSPSSADGLQSCSPDQIRIGDDSDPSCPNASIIGTVAIRTPLLNNPMTGYIYLADQTPTQLLKIYLVAKGAGVTVKLAGPIEADPVTGQLTATFTDNPQLPVTDIELAFKNGPRAPLVNPRVCGPATTTSALSPWSGQPVSTPSDTFEVSGDGNGAPCPGHQFAPSFVAGTTNPVAGADSPLTVRFGRADADEMLRGITVSLPRGVLARIASTTLCADGPANAGTCGEESRIGSTTTAAGPGSSPIELPGRVYMTDKYKDAPFGLSIVVPAKAGPFDLGNVVVRAAVYVDPVTTELRIVSDPLPTILKGIPLQIRMVNVRVDKPGFTLNPTNCSKSSIGGLISSVAGDTAATSSRFQAAKCAALPFKPKMTLKVGSRGKLTAGKRTPLEVTLSMSRGQANNRSVQVTLPLALNARLDVVNKRRACTLEQFRADRCPMVVGQATAVTPLLRDPLKGPAYFVYTPARRLPDLVVRLRGQVSVDLTGKVTITKDLRLRTTFDTIPDVPITKFRLSLASGRTNGPVGVVRNLCAASTRKGLRAGLGFVAQSGKKISRDQKISVAGCGKAKKRAARTKKK